MPNVYGRPARHNPHLILLTRRTRSLRVATMNSFVLRFTFLSVACALALAGSPEPLSKVDVVALLAAGSRTDYLVNLARARGIRFAMDEQFTDLLKSAGADELLLITLRAIRSQPQAESDQERQALPHLANCAAASRHGSYSNHETECTAALELLPNEPAVLMAAAYVQLGSDETARSAIADAEQAVSLTPKFSEAHRILGYVVEFDCRPSLNEMCSRSTAVDEFRESIRLDPDNVAAHTDLGLALENKHMKSALCEFHEAAKLAPSDSSIHYMLAAVLRSAGNLREALSEYATAIRLNPNLPEAYDQRAGILDELGERQAAIEEEQKGIAVDPNYFASRLTLSKLLTDDGDWEGGMAQLREAAARNPKNPFPVEYMVDSLRKRKDFDEAIAILRQAIQDWPPGWANYHYVLAELLGQKGDLNGALAEYREVVEIAGDSPDVEKNIHRIKAKLARKSIAN
jgi:tetratricopeptide (TPR) repeat protein